jgi:hypothetical protein
MPALVNEIGSLATAAKLAQYQVAIWAQSEYVAVRGTDSFDGRRAVDLDMISVWVRQPRSCHLRILDSGHRKAIYDDLTSSFGLKKPGELARSVQRGWMRHQRGN